MPDPGALPDVSGPPPLCEPSGAGTPVPCYRLDYPDWVGHVNVPIAENHGAGNDMTSAMRYSSTVVTKAGTAVQAGSAGFVEANGAVTYEHEKTTNLAWADQGPNHNVRAILDSAYLRERSGACYKNFDTGEWQCQYETVYRPSEAGGTTRQDSWTPNDTMDTAQDCWEPVDSIYEPVTKSETQSTFSFRLGPDENWSIAANNQGALYANTTITQQTNNGKSHIRSWKVVPSPTYSHHYVYVPNGKVGLDTQTTSNAACVRDRLGDVQTDAQNYDWNNPPPSDTVPPPPSTGPDPTADENDTYQPVCGNMPDRCD